MELVADCVCNKFKRFLSPRILPRGHYQVTQNHHKFIDLIWKIICLQNVKELKFSFIELSNKKLIHIQTVRVIVTITLLLGRVYERKFVR